MKNHKMFRRFIAASTTAVLAFGSVAPVTTALAAENDQSSTAGAAAFINDLISGKTNVDDLLGLLNLVLADQGFALTKPDASGLANVALVNGDLTSLKLDVVDLLLALGLDASQDMDMDIDLEGLYNKLGLSAENLYPFTALIGGIIAGQPDALLGFLDDVNLDDITMGAIAEALGNSLAKAYASLPSIEGIASGAKSAYDAVYNAELNIPVNLDKLAEAVGLDKSVLPKGIDSFEDLKDVSNVFDALLNADLNDYVKVADIIEKLGLDKSKLPSDLLDANNLLKPAELKSIWEQLDLNALVDLKSLVDKAGFGGYELPDALFDANSVKDLSKLEGIFDELDLNQLLDLNALLETDIAKGVLDGLGIDWPESVDELNDLKKLENLSALLHSFDFEPIAKNVRVNINNKFEFSLADLGFDEIDDFVNPETYQQLAKQLGDVTVGQLIDAIIEALDLSTDESQWLQMADGSWKYWDAEKQSVATGWKLVNGKWYLFDVFGTMFTGWQQNGGKWYLLSANGDMQTGWQFVNGHWYLLGASGAMKTGWQQVGNTWYYLSANGDMQTGWQFINGHWFYLGGANDGAMRTGTFTDESGRSWTCDANGYWIA